MDPIGRKIHEITAATMTARAEWLEDVLAGLLAAGVSAEEIEIQHHPNLILAVTVRGEEKYRHQIKITPEMEGGRRSC